MVVEQKISKVEQPQVTRRADEERRFQPATDIIETAESVVLRLDMPGVSKENVDLTVDKDTLTIVGKTRPEESWEAVYRETYIGDYQRQFTLTT
ncbi:MAG: Hsp20/alpha crystallin family protein, partial [Planctomycetes bacterium]|nr:Hsp20/alpha crystallin family protein [Planctomycetota bacterium]